MVSSQAVQSVTNLQIALYWKQRRLVEEDHLCAAVKAAARVRARNLTVNDYLQFQDSLKEDESKENKNSSQVFGKDEKQETRVGIKHWWTKSKYAYLNQPATKLLDNHRKRSRSYLPHFLCYKPASPLTQSHGYSWQPNCQVN